MEKKRGNQVMAIAALFIAVIGLSLGFAAFSNTLTISSSATVTPDASVFDVNFSSAATPTTTDAVVPDKTHTGEEYAAGSYNETNFTATNATITNEPKSEGSTTNASIGNLKVNFTEPGQTVTYSFYARNDGKLEAFLNDVLFTEVESGKTHTCAIKTEGVPEANRATQSLVDAACAAISYDVSVGGVRFTGTTADKETDTTGKKLTVQGTDNDRTPVVVTIKYAPETTLGEYRVDGPMTVTFGDIVLTYGSVD